MHVHFLNFSKAPQDVWKYLFREKNIKISQSILVSDNKCYSFRDQELGQKIETFISYRVCLNFNGFHKNVEAQAQYLIIN